MKLHWSAWHSLSTFPIRDFFDAEKAEDGTVRRIKLTAQLLDAARGMSDKDLQMAVHLIEVVESIEEGAKVEGIATPVLPGPHEVTIGYWADAANSVRSPSRQCKMPSQDNEMQQHRLSQTLIGIKPTV